MEMEDREDLNSILPYLPLLLRSSTLFWPSQAVEILKLLAAGPHHSHLHSGDLLFRSITDLRRSLSLSADPLAFSAHQGYALFFDQLISREESKKWFEGIVPALANLLLRFPSLLESHYQNADNLINGVKTGLRLLNSQEAGLVVLSQELIAALLGCSLFCLFPITIRGDKHLPTINFDHLFASLHDSCDQKQQGKIKCIIHYFERICAQIPGGSVSFERNVLPLEHRPLCVSYPDANFWSGSLVPLCKFEVCSFGLIEDQSSGALEVDFANKYFGGGALHRGCVQEEIRFMINPELIAGMLFLPALADNESIEVVGTERFSNYTGYASSFRFSGDYVDKKEMNSLGRRKTRIVAIDALCCPEMRQYKIKYLLREINKAFCGFMDQSKYYQYDRQLLKNDCSGDEHDVVMKDPNYASTSDIGAEAASTSIETFEESVDPVPKTCQEKGHQSLKKRDDVGIATGNWGCGAFGGDPELKTIIQWLAASQGRRPFIAYYTFGLRALQNLDQVTEWILVHKWTVGDLWNMLVEYCMQVSKGETNDGFFTWLLPSLSSHDEGE
ncbi:poly(ADP-ribose) glycohydrolase 1-like [Humulus lupulus]|uniref:poly(ADP-ribose) glycohydrolase 1-like n=1 Tax=Humulus lupulus TaxID=3486 RepID=UPI002B410F64|nr:poly(ADP-ribose) glycohydrolase 1-like [Humulus lupulus]